MVKQVKIAGSTASKHRMLYLSPEIEYPSSLTADERRTAEILAGAESREIPTLAYVKEKTEILPRGSGETRQSRSPVSALWRRLPLKLRGLRRDTGRVLEPLRWALSEWKEIKNFKPTFIFERAMYLDYSGVLLSKILHIPLVQDLHGFLTEDVRGYYRSPLEFLGAYFERIRYRQIAKIFTVSQGLADWLVSIGVNPDKINVLPCGANLPTEVSKLEETAKVLRKTWKLDNRKIIGWIGHVMPERDFPPLENLAAAMNRLNARLPLAFVFVGGGETMKQLEKFLSSRAKFPLLFTGPKYGFDADAHLKAFDAAVIPANLDYERTTRPRGIRAKLFHYGALRVPILAPNVDSIQAVDKGKNFFHLYEQGDEASLLAGLEKILTDPERSRPADRFFQEVKKKYSWETIISRIFEITFQGINGNRS